MSKGLDVPSTTATNKPKGRGKDSTPMTSQSRCFQTAETVT